MKDNARENRQRFGSKVAPEPQNHELQNVDTFIPTEPSILDCLLTYPIPNKVQNNIQKISPTQTYNNNCAKNLKHKFGNSACLLTSELPVSDWSQAVWGSQPSYICLQLANVPWCLSTMPPPLPRTSRHFSRRFPPGGQLLARLGVIPLGVYYFYIIIGSVVGLYAA